MVKKKGKSKRTTLKDKYKIQTRVTEHHRKQRKQMKRDAKAGKVKHEKKKKDPGIPNSWPFKQELLNEIKLAKERQVEKDRMVKKRIVWSRRSEKTKYVSFKSIDRREGRQDPMPK